MAGREKVDYLKAECDYWGIAVQLHMQTSRLANGE